MRNTIIFISLICVTLLCLTSCSEKNLRYLGYTRCAAKHTFNSTDYVHWGRDYFPAGAGTTRQVGKDNYGSPIYAGFGYSSQDPSGSRSVPVRPVSLNNKKGEHEHHLVMDFRYAEFCDVGYVSECDIVELEKRLQMLTKRNLNRMLTAMNSGSFIYDEFCKRYVPFLSDAIKDKVMSVKVKSNFSDIGGWQILKPTAGLDKKPVLYGVTYVGDDSYEIKHPYNDNVVTVKVVYAGKFLNPVIIELRNDKQGINLSDMSYNTRYNSKMLGVMPYDDMCMYMNFLCPMVGKEMGNKLVVHEDFIKFQEKVVAKEQAFVHEFYDYLLDPGNDAGKVRKKYFNSMPQRIVEMIDDFRHEGVKNVDMFLPCSYDDFKTKGYKVSYLGKDCFEVSTGGKSLYLKVVLYGNKLTPAIMGISNPIREIEYCPNRFVWFDEYGI